MSILERSAVADRILSDMARLLPVHPRTYTVLAAKAILDNTDPQGNVGSVGYTDGPVDWEPVKKISLLEVSEETAPAIMSDIGSFTDGELGEDGLNVLLSEDMPEQSVITVLEIPKAGAEPEEKRYMVFKSTGIGINGAGGRLYQLIRFRDHDQEIDDAIEQEIEQETGVPVTPEPASGSYIWGSKS